MRFIENVEKEEYKNFVDNHEKSHFLQSYEWGVFCQKAKGQIPHYVGMHDDKETLVATALLLEKKTPLGYSYVYCPRGYLIDYKNKAHVKLFTNYLKEYMKKEKIIYIKIDPDIKYQDINEDACKIEGGENNYEIFEYLKSIGYKHKGFTKLYEGNQPRYTFRNNLQRPWEEVTSVFNKSFTKSIKRSEQYDLKIDEEIRLHDFYTLMEYNSQKDGFNARNEAYYQSFIDAMDKEKGVKFFNVSIRPKELLTKIEGEIKKLENDLQNNTKRSEDIKNQINRLKKDQEEFKKIEEDEVVICSLICTYTANRAWSLFIGSNELANLTFAVSRVYYEAIKDAYHNGYEFFDLFGTTGDPKTTYKNLAHLHDFKRKFGGEYIEFIGEFDLISKPFLYKILPILLKIYRKIRG